MLELLENLRLIDELEDGVCTQQYAQRAAECDAEEDVQHDAVNDHRYILPIFAIL